MTATTDHAIRHAIPALLAIADEAEHHGRTSVAARLNEVVADLRDALDGSEALERRSGPTTAQDGPEGLSGQMSGVSGQLHRMPDPYQEAARLKALRDARETK